jgi:hypothetical protein
MMGSTGRPARLAPAFVARTIVTAGLVAGILDISDDILYVGRLGIGPMKLGQFVASGALGANAFTGGWNTAALGYAVHFFVALSAAAVYIAAAIRWPSIARRPFVWGPLFGIGLYLFMNAVVIPLSATAKGSYSVAGVVNQLFAHIVLVGLPIALIARRRFAMDPGNPLATGS